MKHYSPNGKGIMGDLWRDFWIRETGTGQQVAQLHDRYDDDDDDGDDDDDDVDGDDDDDGGDDYDYDDGDDDYDDDQFKYQNPDMNNKHKPNEIWKKNYCAITQKPLTEQLVRRRKLLCL